MQPVRFNIRVYGIWLHEQQLLLNEELIKGSRIIKFPGGGLQLGEGMHEGLKREWMEELNMEIDIIDHFYTTDFYQPSAFDDSQVISIYYMVRGNAPEAIVNTMPNERTYWHPLAELQKDSFTLPIDKIVGEKILDRYR